MRRPERIPVILQLLPVAVYLKDLDFLPEEQIDAALEELDIEAIKTYWEGMPDLRLTQVLVNMDIIPNVPGTWYYTEEDEWMLDKGILTENESPKGPIDTEPVVYCMECGHMSTALSIGRKGIKVCTACEYDDDMYS